MSNFKCERCGETYMDDSTFTDEDRIKEYKRDYPNDPNIEMDIASVCEDCFQEYQVWFKALTIEQKERIEREAIKNGL